MAGRLIFSDQAWDDYLWWQREDRVVLKRINRLIEAARRDPFEGIGKPEPLRFTLAGAWSRRITDEHRMVYVPRDADIDIAALRYHYK
ncbi:MAG: Txe/YoeB family addiction module toxin [Actinobacteria bacterium]|nr:Txe/YoeB family addiction module toxin [Actinomycetota bacterium]